MTSAAEARMGTFDAVMWGVENDPLLRSVIVAMVILDRPPDEEVLTDRVERMTLAVPKLRQRAIGNPMSIVPPRWETDPNFDLAYHVRRYNVNDDNGLRPAIEIAEIMAMQDFDRARPLWEAALIKGLPDGRAVVILKIHHSITDGVGGMQMVANLFDLSREPRDMGPRAKEPEPNVLNAWGRLSAGVGYETEGKIDRLQGYAKGAAGLATKAVKAPIGSATDAATFIKSAGRLLAPANVPLSPLMTARSLSVRLETYDCSIDELKAAARSGGGKLNDAFVAGVAGALGRYHARHGVQCDALRVNMPINVRTESDTGTGGNKWVPARFPVPINIEDPAERVRSLHHLLLAARTEPALVLVEPVTRNLNRLPRPLTTQVAGGLMKGVDFAATNVPGAPIPIYMARSEALGEYAFAPKGGAAVNFALLSHVGTACIGINIDTKAIPDPAVFMECVHEGFEEVLALGKES